MRTKTVTIPPEVADLLRLSTVEGPRETPTLKLPPGQLARPLYEATDKVLKAMGGKWDRKAGGHRFNRPIDDQIAAALGDGQVTDMKKTLEQFWTPPDLVNRMCDFAGDMEGVDVLEPSAGWGHILFEIIGRGGLPFAVELDREYALRLESETEGKVPIAQGDFLQWRPRPPYTPAAFDLVLMNPPFSRNQDISHVLHAYGFLKPGGRLVAIMSPHWRFAQETIARQFRDWVDSVKGVWRPVPGGSFKASGTMIEAGILVVNKGD